VTLAQIHRQARDEWRRQRRHKWAALFRRFVMRFPGKNPHRMIAEKEKVSVWLVYDVLGGRR
jgi:hypothetical protein